MSKPGFGHSARLHRLGFASFACFACSAPWRGLGTPLRAGANQAVRRWQQPKADVTGHLVLFVAGDHVAARNCGNCGHGGSPGSGKKTRKRCNA